MGKLVLLRHGQSIWNLENKSKFGDAVMILRLLPWLKQIADIRVMINTMLI